MFVGVVVVVVVVVVVLLFFGRVRRVFYFSSGTAFLPWGICLKLFINFELLAGFLSFVRSPVLSPSSSLLTKMKISLQMKWRRVFLFFCFNRSCVM
jgi:hypothetical protein